MAVYSRMLTSKTDGSSRRVWTASVGSGAARKRKDFQGKKQADAWHADMLSRINSGTTVVGKSPSLRQYYLEYVEYCEGRVRRREGMGKTHLKSVRGLFENYILADKKPDTLPTGSRRIPFDRGIGDIKLADLTAARVEKFKDELRDDGVSLAHTKMIVRLLHTALEKARRSDYVRVNPASGIRIHSKREDKSKRVIPPSTLILSRMIAECDHPILRVLIILLAATGLRISEAYALRWRHIDFDDRKLSVESRLCGVYRDEDVPKTSAGFRKIPLGYQVVTELANFRAVVGTGRDTDLIFQAANGSYRRSNNDLKRLLVPLYQRVAEGLPLKERMEAGKFGFHAIRHYAISAWIAQGLNAKIVSAYAGHASIAITMDRYGHLMAGDDHTLAMDAISTGLF